MFNDNNNILCPVRGVKTKQTIDKFPLFVDICSPFLDSSFLLVFLYSFVYTGNEAGVDIYSMKMSTWLHNPRENKTYAKSQGNMAFFNKNMFQKTCTNLRTYII